MHMLATSGVQHGWLEQWVSNVRSWVPPGVASHGDVCVRVAVRAGMMEFIPSGPRGSSVSPEGGMPRATNSSSLLGILHWETGAEAAGEAHWGHSKAPLTCRLMPWQCHWEAQW